MSGYHLLVSAMVLQSVDRLSDDDGPPAPVPKVVPTPKAKLATTPKVKADAKKVLPKKRPAPAEGEPKKGESMSLDAQAQPKTKAEKKQVVMKRPAASSSKATAPAAATEPGKVSVSKGLYKNGAYGFKVNQREVLKVGNSMPISCTFETQCFRNNPLPPNISPELKPVDGLTPEDLETIAETWLNDAKSEKANILEQS